ncbi:MAG TPA: aspartate-semialdehyde dehydrogenase [Candidatus Eisenbacteria bacterium]|nr:aspartate-semialdehyde dehydrogenase [Candidatus Eisenbacteria bacterium]
MKRKFNVGIIGGTGYVGQRFVTLLNNHPWFKVTTIAASPRSAGKTYLETMQGRWKINADMPDSVKDIIVQDSADLDKFINDLDFVFCAVDMDKEALITLEETIAKHEVAVVSNNSANRWTADVPMIIPEINPEHSALIEAQRKRLGTKNGFIAVKPNCSIQSYVPTLTPLRDYGIEKIQVSTYQAVSGAGKTLTEWPEIMGNVIPFIGGEEEKSEKEPLKVWGSINQAATAIDLAENILISAQCYRVAVQDGHLAAVSVAFNEKPDRQDILDAWKNFKPYPQEKELPSAPRPFLQYLEADDRPQQRLDAEFGNGFGVSIGRLRKDSIFDYKFACLSHNTIRGAAGGAILTAELLVDQGYITLK